uniref:Uncharacterized protein n=1 Tax=Setaria italica TaxID=4555 RepID=K3ZPJ1_SETIT
MGKQYQNFSFSAYLYVLHLEYVEIIITNFGLWYSWFLMSKNLPFK